MENAKNYMKKEELTKKVLINGKKVTILIPKGIASKDIPNVMASGCSVHIDKPKGEFVREAKKLITFL